MCANSFKLVNNCALSGILQLMCIKPSMNNLYACARSHFLCAQTFKVVCARIRAQLRAGVPKRFEQRFGGQFRRVGRTQSDAFITYCFECERWRASLTILIYKPQVTLKTTKVWLAFCSSFVYTLRISDGVGRTLTISKNRARHFQSHISQQLLVVVQN